MLKYRGAQLVKAGLFGVVLIAMIIAIGLQPEQIKQWATSVRYQAEFTEAGGIIVGNQVTLSGIKIGTVSDIALHDGNALVTFTALGEYPLGSQTTAHIRTGSLLGERILTLEPAGNGRMRPGDLIPVSRTSSPYSLTDAIGELTSNSAGTNTESLNQSLDTLSATLDQIAPKLGPTFDGLSRMARSLNSRDESLGSLLKSAADVTSVLAQRSGQLNTLILDANDLLGVLNDRREAIVALLANTSAVSKQLSGLVNDNQKTLEPTLRRLNRVTEVLERNRDNITKMLPDLRKFMLSQGETLANGPYYNAYVPNLNPAQILQPFLDYAFGFRRGVHAGQPPDNAGPRAEVPLPYNGIPGGSR